MSWIDINFLRSPKNCFGSSVWESLPVCLITHPNYFIYHNKKSQRDANIYIAKMQTTFGALVKFWWKDYLILLTVARQCINSPARDSVLVEMIDLIAKILIVAAIAKNTSKGRFLSVNDKE